MTQAVNPGAVPPDLVELGRITAAYGVKGWIKVQPHSAQAEVLRSVKQWWLLRPVPQAARGSAAPVPVAHAIVQSRAQGSTVVAQLAGLSDRDQAEALRGCVVLASRSAFPQPGEDEYYWVDLIGCDLYSTAEGPAQLLGRVEEVLDNGAHAILRVARLRAEAEGQAPQPVLDAKGRPADMLVPFVQAHIHGVDLAARRIDSDWPVEY
ncbi:ribosome maturation factor RimM [Bordetella ansorpii]|uniref:ribosome maturation factor RimM n=1 Tax=Bordetella ansorpii TaxID=288768 RepID=UPI0008253D60|nr:ribosome maturation factor RimM [Bordetella ansorpii]